MVAGRAELCPSVLAFTAATRLEMAVADFGGSEVPGRAAQIVCGWFLKLPFIPTLLPLLLFPSLPPSITRFTTSQPPP